mmetsp:Transcript_1809/g.3770  ORF Transcript_1809/g.3770 Transcript_1809/m.3770 type:complete len:256 (+) Transcript_1809:1-768(+)
MDVSLHECDDVHDEYPACVFVNARAWKVPRSSSDRVSAPQSFNDVVFHDLFKSKCRGAGGFVWVSVLVDGATRKIDLLPLKHKWQAVMHLIAWTRKYEKLGKGKPKVVCSDNGGEFTARSYERFCRQEGIHHEFGAPYTPESQGRVERVNASVKALVQKFFLSLRLPSFLWPFFLQGVAQQLNSTVHSATGLSPDVAVFGKGSAGVSPVTVGDQVRFVDRAPGHVQGWEPRGDVGFFGGVLSTKVVSVVCNRKGR